MTILQDAYLLGLDGEALDQVVNGSAMDIKNAHATHGGTIEMYNEINKLAKRIKPELKGLPCL